MKSLKVRLLKILSGLVSLAGIAAFVACFYYQYPPLKVILYLPLDWSEKTRQVLGGGFDYSGPSVFGFAASAISFVAGVLLVMPLTILVAEIIKDWAKSVELGSWAKLKEVRAQEHKKMLNSLAVGNSGTFVSIDWVSADTVAVTSTDGVYFCKFDEQPLSADYFKGLPCCISKTAYVWVMDGKLHIGSSAEDKQLIIFGFHSDVKMEGVSNV